MNNSKNECFYSFSCVSPVQIMPHYITICQKVFQLKPVFATKLVNIYNDCVYIVCLINRIHIVHNEIVFLYFFLALVFCFFTTGIHVPARTYTVRCFVRMNLFTLPKSRVDIIYNSSSSPRRQRHYLMNYNTNLHSNIKLHNYNL